MTATMFSHTHTRGVRQAQTGDDCDVEAVSGTGGRMDKGGLRGQPSRTGFAEDEATCGRTSQERPGHLSEPGNLLVMDECDEANREEAVLAVVFRYPP